MKKVVSIRLDDKIKKQLQENYEGVQSGIDFALENLQDDEHVIYMVTNLLDKRQYIGMSKNVLRRFLDGHSKASTDLGKDIRRLGKDKFSLNILCKVPSKRTALDVEAYFIGLYGTDKDGYNGKLGRPRKGKGIKQVCSIRLEPSLIAEIKAKYGSLQKAVDYIIENDEDLD